MKICVVGGGAAGLAAALAAARQGAQTVLVESNEKLGKKIYITGKGRCNLTNLCPPEEFLSNVPTNPKFLFSAINFLTPEKTVALFNELGLPTKTERGNRVFPLSDKASDVTKALEKELGRLGADILLNTAARKINTENGIAVSLDTTAGGISFDKLILACGGASYPATGSNGRGYALARGVGHTVKSLYPSLVDITTEENFFLAGLSLVNVNFSVFDQRGKRIFMKFGELLFTHEGVSGPVVLTASAYINKLPVKGMKLVTDLKPALSAHQLDGRILRDFSENKNKQFKNSLSALLPEKLISAIIALSGIDPDKQVNRITSKERAVLVKILKGFTLTAASLGPIERAVATSGGVDVREVDPRTMASRLVKNLYFAGEMIDVDALTGGFNLQTAFSTGFLAGCCAAGGNLK